MSIDDTNLQSAKLQSDNVVIALLQNDVRYLSRQIIEMREEVHEAMEKRVLYVEFTPVKQIAFGLVIIATASVVGALVALVVKGG